MLLLAGTVVYVNTGAGKLILEVNEPDVKVTVNGKDIQIKSPRDEITVAVHHAVDARLLGGLLADAAVQQGIARPSDEVDARRLRSGQRCKRTIASCWRLRGIARTRWEQSEGWRRRRGTLAWYGLMRMAI